MRIGPDHTRPGLDTCQLQTPAWALIKAPGVFYPRTLGPYCGRPEPHMGGLDPILGVQSIHVGVLDQLRCPDCISRGPARVRHSHMEVRTHC
jgi:hypothetical protein